MARALPQPLSSRELARLVGARHEGPEAVVHAVAPLSRAGRRELAFALRDLAGGDPGVVVARAPFPGRTTLVADDPKLAFCRLLEALFPPPPREGIHPTAVVEGEVGPGVHLGPHAWVAAGARVEADCWIGAGAVIAEHCVVGRGTVIHPRVVLYPRTRVGAGCIVHAGAVLGADGFSFHPTPEGLVKVPQVGQVVVEDAVEIGACTCIDRAFLDVTRVGRGVKLDNLVQVGHNVEIGEGTVIAAQAGISGSCRIGRRVQVGGQAGFRDHVAVGDRARVGAKSGVSRSIPEDAAVLGIPALPIREARRVFALMGRLPAMWRDVRSLLQRVRRLEEGRH